MLMWDAVRCCGYVGVWDVSMGYIVVDVQMLYGGRT